MQTIQLLAQISCLTPHFQEQGSGPKVLCLHSSTSSSNQWRPLMQRLSANYRVMAPDLYGYGKNPAWRTVQDFSLDHEVELIEPLLSPSGVHLIAHSYGAAVALKTALTYPERIRSLVLYEPVMFKLLFNEGPTPAASEVQAVQADIRRALATGQPHVAAQRFVDYWSGEGVWDRLPDWRQAMIAGKMSKVVADFGTADTDGSVLADYADLQIPTLYLYGAQAPTSTQRIARLLGAILPQVELKKLNNMGHMGPISHAEQINGLIEDFLGQRHSSAAWQSALAA